MSFLKVHNLVCTSYSTFLACLVSSSSESSSDLRTPFHVPIMGEYVDVFLDELLGLPPPWEIEFDIELVPRAVLISKALY